MIDRLSRRRLPEPAISSKDVNRALRDVVWPALKDVGFERRTARTAWRDCEDQVDVVNFQSCTSYLADGLEGTTFSFGVSRGAWAIKQKDGHLREARHIGVAIPTPIGRVFG